MEAGCGRGARHCGGLRARSAWIRGRTHGAGGCSFPSSILLNWLCLSMSGEGQSQGTLRLAGPKKCGFREEFLSSPRPAMAWPGMAWPGREAGESPSSLWASATRRTAGQGRPIRRRRTQAARLRSGSGPRAVPAASLRRLRGAAVMRKTTLCNLLFNSEEYI